MSNRTELMADTADIFRQQFGSAPQQVTAAPGRANIIGEHTDYNDGHVLPIAIDRFTVAAGANRDDRMVRIYAANFSESFQFNLDHLPAERPHWAAYVLGVLAEMERARFRLHGKDLAIFGDVPIGSGLSSSAALEVSVATAVERLEGLKIDDARLVHICRMADHHFVGVKSGPMDQFASRACKKGHAGLLDCRSLKMTHQQLPENISFFSIYSGIPRALANSEYNERQQSCQKAVTILSKKCPEIKALRDATPAMIETLKDEMGDRIYRRARHVVTEQERVFQMVEAFARSDLKKIGALLLAGHRSLSKNYEVSLPILDEMIEWLYRVPGVIGARLTGAGFGGSLICLTETGKLDVPSFLSDFAETFARQTPEKPRIRKLTTVDGAKYQ